MLSEHQERALEYAANNYKGVTKWLGSTDLDYSTWEQMMEGLAEKGFVLSYIWGGYRITEAGRAALEKPQ